MKQATKFLMSSTVVAVALAAGAVALFGQWADYPTTGPRTSDGKVDLKAPPPRTAEGKIDFTGLWEPARGGPGRGAGQAKGQAKGAPAVSPSPAPPPSPSPSPEFCRCGLRNYGCKTRECIARCAPQCSFVSDENNGTSSIIISSNTAPLSIIIHFQVEDAGTISIKIYDVAGRLIKTLAADKMDQGSHEVEWNEQDEEGNLVDAGIYILQLDTPNKSETKKIAMIN